jgi:hypothetical protein
MLVQLFRGAPGTTQGMIRPVRPGWRPYTQMTRGKRNVQLEYSRGSQNATPNYGNIGVFGIEMPYDTAQFGVNSSGQLIAGSNPLASSLSSILATGTTVEKIKLTGGAGTGVGFINVIDGGADITAAPTVVFTPATGAPAATAIIRDRRVVGIVVTAAGGPFTTAPVITFTGGGAQVSRPPQAVAMLAQQATVNTHIPFVAQGGLAAGTTMWVVTAEVLGGSKIIAPNLNSIAAFNNADDGAVDPDAHLMGISGNAGFTVATGTNPDGTTAVGIITLCQGLPNGTIVNVYAGTVREISALALHQGDQTQIRATDLMWVVAGAAGNNSQDQVILEPIVGAG